MEAKALLANLLVKGIADELVEIDVEGVIFLDDAEGGLGRGFAFWTVGSDIRIAITTQIPAHIAPQHHEGLVKAFGEPNQGKLRVQIGFGGLKQEGVRGVWTETCEMPGLVVTQFASVILQSGFSAEQCRVQMMLGSAQGVIIVRKYTLNGIPKHCNICAGLRYGRMQAERRMPNDDF